MKKKDLIVKMFWIGVICIGLWFWISSNKEKPEYIREEFNNGKTIEMPVDESITKNNWKCTGDCSGHNAGYEWAEDKGITDPSDCGGKSRSFIEGCEAYANKEN